MDTHIVSANQKGADQLACKTHTVLLLFVLMLWLKTGFLILQSKWNLYPTAHGSIDVEIVV